MPDHPDPQYRSDRRPGEPVRTTLVQVTCPDCDGRGFMRVGALEEQGGLCRFCDRCDGRGSFHVTP